MSSWMRTTVQTITNSFSAILRLYSERQSPSREENSVGKTVSTCEPSVNNQNFLFISENLSSNEWCRFGRKLGLDTVVLDDLEKDANIHKHGREETIVRMLEKWQQRVNLSDEERDHKLKTALTDIGRNDIAAKIQEEVDDPDLLKKIQEALKKLFRNVTLPTSVWLDKKILPLEELFVEPTMKNDGKQGGDEHKNINIEEVFLETEKGIPRRILVEGQPGYGKTTLVTKFLSDWAREKKYLTDRFDLVFVIPLRNYTGKKLSYYLHQNCEVVKTSEYNKMRVIESITERVLLLLDGLDEIPSDVKEKISPLIMGDEYPEMTVVVTCRVGFLKLETKSNVIFQAMKIRNSETESIWEKRVKIQGISPDKRKEFLRKYLNVNEEKLGEQLSQTNLILNDLYECPLFLLLLAVLVQEKDIHQIKTKTELYKTIFNFVINRGLERLTGKREELDVFDLKSESDEFGCQNFLINFGRLCLEKIKKQSLIFEKSEILNCLNGNGGDEDLIFKLGFLSKQVIFFNFEERELYEPVHRSFLEFSAAFYLCLSDEMESEIQELVTKWNIRPEYYQLLYPFLGGLLHDSAFQMFNAFSAFKHLITVFSNSKHNVEKVLLEIPETEENLKSLENLAIGNWERVKYEESLHFWFAGLMKNRSEEIFLDSPENLDIINGVSDDIKVNTFRVSVNEEMKKENMIIEKTILCQNLIIILKNFNKNIPLILKEMSKIKAEKVWLLIEGYSSPAVSSYLAEDFCEIFHENLRMTVYEKLIERFPEDLIEGIGRNVDEDLPRVLHEEFQTKMRNKIDQDFDKASRFDSDEEIDVELDQCFGDEIKQKLDVEICEKFGEKFNEISRDMLEDKLFEKFYKELNYIYKYIGQQYCTFFGRELGDLLNVSVCEILSENSDVIEVSLFIEWILKRMIGVLDKVVLNEIELDAVVFDEDVEIDRKCKLLGQEICSLLGMKKRIVDTLNEKIFCLIAIETNEKLDKELVQRIDKEIFFLIREYLDKRLNWLNEAEIPFNIYHLSLRLMSHNVFTVFAPLIQDLIQKKKIEHGIKIDFRKSKINDSFIKTYNSFVEIVSSSHLKSFAVDTPCVLPTLPFPITLFNNEKQMEFIGLRGFFQGINVDQIKTVSVDHFDCVDLILRDLLPKLISTFTNLKKLSCHCYLINILGDRDSITEWKQLKTIDHLEILIVNEEMINNESFLKGISLFHNVRELGLVHFKLGEFKYIGLGEFKYIGFVARLPSLKKIHYHGLVYPYEFFKKLLNLKFEQGEKGLRLDAVEFELNDYHFSEKDIKDIELCFEKNIFHKFSIISYRTNDLGNILEYFICKPAFKVYCEWKEVYFDLFYYRIDDETKKRLRPQLTICLANVK